MPSVDWERIRAEYIAGGISFRDLAEKHGVSKDAIGRKAKQEKWVNDRDKTATKVRQKTDQKIVAKQADAAADNVEIAQRIRAKLLRRLEHEIDSMPETVGTDTHQSSTQRIKGADGQYTTKDMYRAYKLKDLTAAYKDLTVDMDLTGEANDDNLDAFLEGMKHA